MTLYLKVKDGNNETIILNGLCTKEELKRELFAQVEQKSMTRKEAYHVLENGIKAPTDGALRIKFRSQGTIIIEKSGGVTEYTKTVSKGTVIDVYSNCTYKECSMLDYIVATIATKIYA